MDISAITAAFDLMNKAISVFRNAKNLLPNSPEKEAVEKSFDEAESAMKMAEVKVAKELGYQICKCTWPPQIMLSIGYEEYGEKFQCPKCKNVWPPEDAPPLKNWHSI